MNTAQAEVGQSQLLLPPEREERPSRHVSHVASSAMVGTTPADLLRLAVDKGADLDQIERFMTLKDRWEATEARKAYVVAMTTFKAAPPTIVKDRHVSFQTSKGTTAYDHATLAGVTSAICAGLAKHGLSHRWDVKQVDGGQIIVTCVITHQLGHSESVQMQSGRDESGGKNNIQAVASTVTYLQRYTLLAATGLATQDMVDDDGRKSGEPIDASKTAQPSEKQKPSLPICSDEQFKTNFPAWAELIKSARKSAPSLIATLETKTTLTEQQKQKIRAVQPEAVQ